MNQSLLQLGLALLTIVTVLLASRKLKLDRDVFDASQRNSEPKLGTDVGLQEKKENGEQYPPWIYLVTTLYNDGAIPAESISGEWRLLPANNLKGMTVPLFKDSVGANGKWELSCYKLVTPENSPLKGHEGLRSHQAKIVLELDLSFQYRGQNARGITGSIRNRWEYDGERMVRILAADK
jgi:hypothetical protein